MQDDALYIRSPEKDAIPTPADLSGIDIETISPVQWELARKRQIEIERLLSLDQRTESDVREAAERLGCSRTGVYGMLKRYREQGTLLRFLAPGRKVEEVKAALTLRLRRSFKTS